MPSTAKPESRVVWSPQPGSQVLFLSCPIYEVLYEGTRGPGKTDALLMDFAQHVGRGHGEDWRGVLFRRTYKQLSDVIAKSRKWFHRIFPAGHESAATFNASDHVWRFATGEELLLRYINKPADYWNYHGHEYPWIGFEELTNWPSLECYHVMKACSRSSAKGVPRKYRATCNPYGVGHNAVKAYFIDPSPAGVPFVPEAADLPEGVALPDQEPLHAVRITGHYSENHILLDADPAYPQRIAAAASNPEQAKAWLDGNWDIVAGGMFDDLWRGEGKLRSHVLPDFNPPEAWTMYRAYDWGSSKPFSVGWWLEANGEAVTLSDGREFCPPRGSRIRWAEWYGWDGKNPNTGLRMTDTAIGKGIVEREERWGVRGRVQAGPADGSIFSADPGHETPAEAMSAAGAPFANTADKSAGSRKRGWEVVRRMLEEAGKERPEGPGLWVTERCRQFIRTIPTLPRSEKDPDDVDTDAEDHIADETRYAVTAPNHSVGNIDFEV